MLFNSYIFIFAFLPVVLLGFYALPSLSVRARVYWLTLASLFFYSWWNPLYLLLLLISIMVNYGVGVLIGKKYAKIWLLAGLAFNLGLIGYYKYFWFALSQIFSATQIEKSFDFASPLLPLGISFFTFQQIAYLVDRYQRKVASPPLREYALFVSFFPQLIAGPIVHQKEILPQLKNFARAANSRWVALGAACFILGLAKKTLLADPLGMVAAPLFEQSLSAPLSFSQSWLAALSYTLQLYFDFSAYSDMAIGLGLLFGIRLPLNFFSPYKALNIIDFWRRWHMTLSRFLRDYVYIPLGGNRKGGARRYLNLMLTMLIGGLWHGAGWTFILWGGLHGLFLCLNYLWRWTGLAMPRGVSWLITFIAVVFAWALFRAQSLESAFSLWHSMLSPSLAGTGGQIVPGFAIAGAGLFIALFMPNVHQWLRGRGCLRQIPVIGRWRPSAVQGLALGGLLFLCLLLMQFVQAEFLYFNF
ncbi:MAG: MBOAT family protein [Alphaproteobacteria bacterium]|nr:MBOAT family protein [Alphaproteobacteria bacterium]